MYVKNEQGERLLVYVLENGEVVPKYPEDSMEGFDLTEVFCLGSVSYTHLTLPTNPRV